MSLSEEYRLQLIRMHRKKRSWGYSKKPKQVENWCKVLSKSFGNVKLSGAYIPSFDCNWNFASSIMK